MTRPKAHETLIKIFPVSVKITGEKFLQSLAHSYSQSAEACSPESAEFGDHFANFAAQFPQTEQRPYLADLLKLEWMWQRIFSKPSKQKINFLQLSQYYPTHCEKIIFTLPENCFLICSDHPLDEIFAQKEIDAVSPQKFHFLVWRYHSEIRIDRLPEEQWHILNWMRAGRSITHISAQLKIDYPHISISELLPQFVHKAWVTGFMLGPAV